MTRVGLVDIGLSNLGSITSALSELGADITSVYSSSDLSSVDRLIFPGVGSFNEAMERLDECGLTTGIRKVAEDGMPILGVCLGMQLLASRGEEGGGRPGLGLISGEVRPLPRFSENHRVPHVGWNGVSREREHALLRRIPSGADFYFVHGFFFTGTNSSVVVGVTEHGIQFPSVIAKDNVAGVQFHPEKSQKAGSRLIENFLSWGPEC